MWQCECGQENLDEDGQCAVCELPRSDSSKSLGSGAAGGEALRVRKAAGSSKITPRESRKPGSKADGGHVVRPTSTSPPPPPPPPREDSTRLSAGAVGGWLIAAVIVIAAIADLANQPSRNRNSAASSDLGSYNDMNEVVADNLAVEANDAMPEELNVTSNDTGNAAEAVSNTTENTVAPVVGRPIHFVNLCPYPIVMYLRWRGVDGIWTITRPFRFSPSHNEHLRHVPPTGEVEILTDTASIQFWAHVPGQDIEWRNGPGFPGESIDVDGAPYPMRYQLMSFEGGEYYLRLTCESGGFGGGNSQ
jgi:hypothetical protein